MPLYASLPPLVRDRALAMRKGFDPAGVVATSRFIASGAQPFASAAERRLLRIPTLLVRGDDEMHPAEVSRIYASQIPACTVVPGSSGDVADAIRAFCDRLAAGLVNTP